MKGIYILAIRINKNIKTKIGKLGNLNFTKGLYVYIGSAQNNLEKRISRHLLKNKKIKWHIDYLLKNKNTSIINVFYKNLLKNWECKIAKRLSKKGVPVERFGCSDCKCKSHLFKIKNLKFLESSFNKYEKD